MLKWLGIALILASTLLYASLLVLPFFAIPASWKVTAVPIVILVGEVTFWLGALILGAQFVARFRRWLNPCAWFRGPREPGPS